MGDLNSQKPFAFKAKETLYLKRQRRQESRSKTHFSLNIKGICQFCGYKAQKIRKFDSTGAKVERARCKACHSKGRVGYIIVFPKDLLPWAISNKNRGLHFMCSKCSLDLYDWSILGAMCSHKTHQPPAGYVCRLCCTKVGKQEECVEAPNIQLQQLQYQPEEFTLNFATYGGGVQTGRVVRPRIAIDPQVMQDPPQFIMDRYTPGRPAVDPNNAGNQQIPMADVVNAYNLAYGTAAALRPGFTDLNDGPVRIIPEDQYYDDDDADDYDADDHDRDDEGRDYYDERDRVFERET